MDKKETGVKTEWVRYTDGHREKNMRDSKGFLLWKEYYNAERLFRRAYYNIDRNLLEKVVDYDENQKPVLEKKIVCDEMGHPVQQKNYSFEGAKKKLDFTEHYVYGKGYFLKEIVFKDAKDTLMWTDKYSQNEKGWTLKERFNPKNQKVESLVMNEKKEVQWKRLFFRNAKGRINKVQGYYLKNNLLLHVYTEFFKNGENLDSCEVYKYDVRGNRIGASHMNAERKELWREIYNYLGKNMVLRELFEEGTQRTEELYNVRRELIQKRHFVRERLEWQENYLYKNHKLVEMVRRSPNHILWRETYEYDVQNLLARINYFEGENEFNSSDVYEYNDKKQKIKVKNYDAQNNLVGSENYVYDEESGMLKDVIYRNKHNKLIERNKVNLKSKER